MAFLPFWRGTESPTVTNAGRSDASRPHRSRSTARCHGNGRMPIDSMSSHASSASVYAGSAVATLTRGS